MTKFISILASALLVVGLFTFVAPVAVPEVGASADAACPTSHRVTFYEDINYGGRSLVVCANSANLDNFSIVACHGFFPKTGWGDCASSIRWDLTGSSYSYCVYKNINYGPQSEFKMNWGTINGFSNLGTGGLNDEISSIKRC